MTLDLRLLGGFQLNWRGAPRVVAAARGRSLLACLALRAGEPQPRARLAPLFWPDSTEAQARTNLRGLLHELGQALPEIEEFLVIAGTTLTWRADVAGTVDVVAFADRARRRQDAAAIAEAVALYRGDLLPECYDEWIVPERARLRDLFAQTLRAGIAAAGAAGDWPDALVYAARLLDLDPLDEESHRQRIGIHLRRGDRSAAIRAYQACEALLRRELGVAPSAATRALLERARRLEGPERDAPEVPPPRAPAPSAPSPPPARAPLALPPLPAALTPLLGREREAGIIATLLRRPQIRVVTLTGPGGIGKTRLALHAAAAAHADFADGVSFVSLAAVSEPDQVLTAIASGLGAAGSAGQSEPQALAALLQQRRVLLVLDNLEQVIDAVPSLAALLAECRGLKLLATSRLSLQLRGEHEFLVAPLRLPEPHQARTLADLAEAPATALFLERAQAANPRFAPTDDDAPTIAAICRHLDGLPLAIELAAPRTKLLPLPTLLVRLDSRLALLTGGPRDLPTRQQTLRATLDWSHALLTAGEQRLLARLAVFEGGGTLAAIEAVAGEEARSEKEEVRTGAGAGAGVAASPGDFSLLDSLAALNNQSLVQRHDARDAEPRFRMLELVREYARERLVASGELAALRARHARYYLALAEELTAELADADQVARQRHLTSEEENIRAVLRWATETGEVVTGLRLASALTGHWGVRGTYREGRAWLEALLARAGDAVPLALRASALYCATMMDWRMGDYARARECGEEALVAYRALDQERESAVVLRVLANIAMIAGHTDAAQALLAEAEQLARAGGHRRVLALVLNSQGELARSARGDYAAAERSYREALSLARPGGTEEVATFVTNLGSVVLRQGNVAEALRLQREGLELRVALGHRRGCAISLEYFGALAVVMGQYALAARCYGAAEALREDLNSPRDSDPADDAEHRHYLALARDRADPARWAEDWARGRAVPLDDAIAAALALAMPREGAVSRGAAEGSLTT